MNYPVWLRGKDIFLRCDRFFSCSAQTLKMPMWNFWEFEMGYIWTIFSTFLEKKRKEIKDLSGIKITVSVLTWICFSQHSLTLKRKSKLSFHEKTGFRKILYNCCEASIDLQIWGFKYCSYKSKMGSGRIRALSSLPGPMYTPCPNPQGCCFDYVRTVTAAA